MNIEEFRKGGYEVIDYIVDYIESLSQRPVTPDVQPGYFTSAFPSPPEIGESFEKIMEDVEKYIMTGITHIHHPGYFAYFPGAPSYAAILSMMMADTIGYVSFNWSVLPCSSELETIILDWLGKMIGLPRSFLFYGDRSRGSGILRGTAGECVMMSMITARHYALKKLKQENPAILTELLLSSLVAYCSTECRSSAKKAATICMVSLKILGTDKHFRFQGKTLLRAIEEDVSQGMVPFFVNACLGTRTTGSADEIDKIGPICEKYKLWLHIDASYAGITLICPEYKHLLTGVEYASSLNVNPDKLMLVHLDCAILFVKDRFKINDILTVDKTSFGYSFSEKDWSYPCAAEFRTLKLYSVIRSYGVEGIQAHVRHHVQLAELFAGFVRSDERFEVISCNFGIVCFRLKGSDTMNKHFLESVNYERKLYLLCRRLATTFVMRFTVCRERANEKDITSAWRIICEHATKVLEDQKQLELEEEEDREIFYWE